MTRDDALEFIDCHGGDPARWPDAGRAAVLALAAADADVAAALAAAQRLDVVLADWAAGTPVAEFDFTAITATRQEHALARWPARWIGGGALAAAVVAGLLVLLPATPSLEIAGVSTSSSVGSATAESNGDGSDAEAFASVFTPTADEEDLI